MHDAQYDISTNADPNLVAFRAWWLGPVPGYSEDLSRGVLFAMDHMLCDFARQSVRTRQHHLLVEYHHSLPHSPTHSLSISWATSERRIPIWNILTTPSPTLNPVPASPHLDTTTHLNTTIEGDLASPWSRLSKHKRGSGSRADRVVRDTWWMLSLQMHHTRSLLARTPGGGRGSRGVPAVRRRSENAHTSWKRKTGQWLSARIHNGENPPSYPHRHTHTPSHSLYRRTHASEQVREVFHNFFRNIFMPWRNGFWY